MNDMDVIKNRIAEALHRHAAWRNVEDDWMATSTMANTSVPSSMGMRVRRSDGHFVAEVIAATLNVDKDGSWAVLEKSTHLRRLDEAKFEAENMLAARLARLVFSMDDLAML